MSARTPRLVDLIQLAFVAGVGGVLGSSCRGGAEFASSALGMHQWMGRLAVNMVGAALAGLVVGWLLLPEATDPLRAVERPLRRREHLLVTGLLGGLTTVSGFAWDAGALAILLARGDHSAGWRLALVMSGNGCVGLVAAMLGLVAGRRIRVGRPNDRSVGA